MQLNKRNWRLWLLPTSANIISTLLIISGLLWMQSMGAITLWDTKHHVRADIEIPHKEMTGLQATYTPAITTLPTSTPAATPCEDIDPDDIPCNKETPEPSLETSTPTIIPTMTPCGNLTSDDTICNKEAPEPPLDVATNTPCGNELPIAQ